MDRLVPHLIVLAITLYVLGLVLIIKFVIVPNL